jgi:hypothetical protein
MYMISTDALLVESEDDKSMDMEDHCCSKFPPLHMHRNSAPSALPQTQFQAQR